MNVTGFPSRVVTTAGRDAEAGRTAWDASLTYVKLPVIKLS